MISLSSGPHFNIAFGHVFLLHSYFIKQSHQQAGNDIINLQGGSALAARTMDLIGEASKQGRPIGEVGERRGRRAEHRRCEKRQRQAATMSTELMRF